MVAAGSPANKHAAEVVLEVKHDNNLLLCTLLLGNVAVNSLLSILMADLTSGGPLGVVCVCCRRPCVGLWLGEWGLGGASAKSNPA